MIATGYEFEYPALGMVRVNPRRNSNRISARWRDGKVNINVPWGISESKMMRALATFEPRLLSSRPDILYYDGQSFELDGVTITISRQSYAPNQIITQAQLPHSVIEVGRNFDFNKPDTSRTISNMMCRIAQRIAADILIPRARELAAEVNRAPVGWSISNGHRVLGRCDTNGVIALSYILVFLPPQLRDFVIYHELAHLSEMNHSPRFHELCNQYCGGREAELTAMLRAHKWQVYR